MTPGSHVTLRTVLLALAVLAIVLVTGLVLVRCAATPPPRPPGSFGEQRG